MTDRVVVVLEVELDDVDSLLGQPGGRSSHTQLTDTLLGVEIEVLGAVEELVEVKVLGQPGGQQKVLIVSLGS